MNREQYIAGLARARQRVAECDPKDRAALAMALAVLYAYRRLPEMFDPGGWYG